MKILIMKNKICLTIMTISTFFITKTTEELPKINISGIRNIRNDSEGAYSGTLPNGDIVVCTSEPKHCYIITQLNKVYGIKN